MVYQLDLNSCTFDFALSSCLSLPSVYVYCVYPIMSKSIKKKKKCKILLLKSKNRLHSGHFPWCLSRQHLYCYCFRPFALHESGTSKAFIGPWLNNTEVYLTTLLVLKITWLEDNILFHCFFFFDIATGRWFSPGTLYNRLPGYNWIIVERPLNTITLTEFLLLLCIICSRNIIHGAHLVFL